MPLEQKTSYTGTMAVVSTYACKRVSYSEDHAEEVWITGIDNPISYIRKRTADPQEQ